MTWAMLVTNPGTSSYAAMPTRNVGVSSLKTEPARLEASPVFAVVLLRFESSEYERSAQKKPADTMGMTAHVASMAQPGRLVVMSQRVEEKAIDATMAGS